MEASCPQHGSSPETGFGENTTDGREIRLRRITEPTAEQKSLPYQLGLNLPERFQLNCQCSLDPAVA
jgi:hypothetical protein